MKVLFDFDDVIFDAKVFKAVLFQVVEKKGYKNVSGLYDVFRKEDKPFSLRAFLKQVDNSLTDEACEQLYQEIVGFSEHCVNQEVLDVMKKLGKENCSILTSGDEQFQKDKIERSIGYHIASEVVVVPGSKREEIIKFCKRHAGEDIIFVDDKQHFLDEVTQEECSNLVTVLFDGCGFEKLQNQILESRHNELERGEQKERGFSFGMH